MQGLFGNLNNTLNNIGLSGNLGLLTTGVGLLEGQPIGEAVRSGLQTYQGLSSIDEERKRKALVQKLVSEGGFTQQEQALILASQNPAALAAQIRTQKQAAANRPKQATFSILSPDETKALGFVEGDILQRNNLTQDINVLRSATKPGKPQDNFEILSADQANALGFAPGTIVEKNTVTNDYNVIQSPQETPATFEYLTKDQKLNLGFNENSVVQVNSQTKATKVVKEAPKQNETFRILSAVEVANAGFKEGTIVQKSELSGKNFVLEQAPNLDSTRKTLTKPELLAGGFNENDVVQQDETTKALFVIRSASAPKSANLINLLATRDFNLNGQLIKQGQVFALDKNSQAQLINQAINLQTGGAIIAPSTVENITSSQDNILENVDKIISETESKVSGEEFTIGTAAGGDIKGLATDLTNAFLGFTFGVPISGERSRQSAFIANANNQIKVPMVRALAPRGAKYARDEIDKIIPQSTDSNPKFVSKLRQILPDIEITISEVAKEISAAESEKGFGTALGLRGQLENLISYKVSAEKALQNYDANNTKSETQKKADKILEELE